VTRHELDARGLVCPLPVLKARKKLLQMQPGDVLAVAVTDKNALKDFPLFCAESGHVFEKAVEKQGFDEITVIRGA
jgi:tRNA 2-thiouridine synthesizing protein A